MSGYCFAHHQLVVFARPPAWALWCSDRRLDVRMRIRADVLADAHSSFEVERPRGFNVSLDRYAGVCLLLTCSDLQG